MVSSFSRHSRKLSDMAPVMAFDAQVSRPSCVSSGWSSGTIGASRKSGVAAKYCGVGWVRSRMAATPRLAHKATVRARASFMARRNCALYQFSPPMTAAASGAGDEA